MEPQWTKQISSNFVCTTYYYIFIVYAVLAALALIGTIGILVSFKLPKGLSVAIGFQGLLTASIASVLALFQYLVCSRALLGEEVVTVKKGKEYSQ
jgi:predicted small integral membrane protein